MNLLHGCYGVGGLTGPLIIRWMRLSGVAWYGVMQICALAALIAAAAYLAALLTSGSIRRQFAAQPNQIHRADLAGYLRERRKRLLLVCALSVWSAPDWDHCLGDALHISEYLREPRWGAAALSCFLAGHHSVASGSGLLSSTAQADDPDLPLRHGGSHSRRRAVGQREYDCLLRGCGLRGGADPSVYA